MLFHKINPIIGAWVGERVLRPGIQNVHSTIKDVHRTNSKTICHNKSSFSLVVSDVYLITLWDSGTSVSQALATSNHRRADLPYCRFLLPLAHVNYYCFCSRRAWALTNSDAFIFFSYLRIFFAVKLSDRVTTLVMSDRIRNHTLDSRPIRDRGNPIPIIN